ncbi:MAG: sigma-54-dependent Fis family transcriptional regulator [Rhodothermaceae bacterium]|nr:sigma-54-dependent Fis family transcriptional regulator [Rhodothermaceae bacterium]MXW32372.1 sigma-54-dependent Fis family transcriptional regulator [Rhodothermaceae bacterium]MXZ17376.1 sigma-54-dependent Fis family transcriptional regulator [Rhodothermaceae bacterium]MYC03309.1 sigma-54-dependent Fis family transcriptional regulator [Rhodothermaceae bacterium]MYE63750.1 sigma-54-dependent Fis family transcriptional regulator [Rhodothermaceae bacterium]
MSASRVLVVDDEVSIRRTLREILEYEDLVIEEATDGEEALNKLRKSTFDVVLLDIKMPKQDGLQVLATCVETWPELPVIMISGHADIKTAVEATQSGAFHFIEKPPDLQHLLVTVRSALERGKLVIENRRLRQALKQQQGSVLVPMLGDSRAMHAVKELIERVGPTEARVLITGEPGTGKELAARWIHTQSLRREGPMVAVNCAAIPSELIESELFGHEKGSFTGANRQRIGKFEQAHSGTLFLDEIGDMSMPAQAKVLRVLQENKLTRVGGEHTINVDVRVVAATNKDLRVAIDDGKFREDLYHRLSVILLNMPPVRERTGDVSMLIEHFASRLAKRNGLPPRIFTSEAINKLASLSWRGNVREVSNVVERLMILSETDTVTLSDVENLVVPASSEEDQIHTMAKHYGKLADFRDHTERLFLQQKLEENNWNVSQTAKKIGIQRSHLHTRIKHYNLERDA